MRTRQSFLRATATVSVIGSVLLLSGCAALVGDPDSAFAKPGGGDLTLSVVNRNFEDVRVYMLRGAARMPLGQVEGLNTRDFQISGAWLGCERVLRLAMVTRASLQEFRMLPIDVVPGQMVEARFETSIGNSSVRIRQPSMEF